LAAIISRPFVVSNAPEEGLRLQASLPEALKVAPVFR
jgi:hypothetical protein